jgi:hypothetical protein
MSIVDAEGLAKELKCSISLLRKVWREYPHFFVGAGRDLRGARFDVDDVLTYLKRRGNYGRLEEQKSRVVGGKVPASGRTDKKGGLSNQTSSAAMGGKEAARGKRTSAKRDPYALLSGVVDSVP